VGVECGLGWEENQKCLLLDQSSSEEWKKRLTSEQDSKHLFMDVSGVWDRGVEKPGAQVSLQKSYVTTAKCQRTGSTLHGISGINNKKP